MNSNTQARVARMKSGYALGCAALLFLYCMPHHAGAQLEPAASVRSANSRASEGPKLFDTEPARDATASIAARAEAGDPSQPERPRDANNSAAASSHAPPASGGVVSSSSAPATSADVAGATKRAGAADPTSAGGAPPTSAIHTPATERAASATTAGASETPRANPTPRTSANDTAPTNERGAPPASTSTGSSASAGGGGVVNINTAGAAELERLPRIGPARAQAIIGLRSKLKQFSRVEQLLQVKGIGRATFRMLRPLLALSGPTTLENKRGR